MFDPQTANLIRNAPELGGLNRERLPEEFTKAFASIVSFRVRLGGVVAALPAELTTKLDEFRRMAATFEGMVALLPQRDDRRSAAYVAAQAHHLLYLARRTLSPNEAPQKLLREAAIASEVSALLLFLIANQPSDAMEMGRILTEIEMGGGDASDTLVQVLSNLASGRLAAIVDAANRDFGQLPPDSAEAASEMLYRRILEGLGTLANAILGGIESYREANEIFRGVQEIAVEVMPWPFQPVAGESLLTPLSTFAGPHHLATLLIGITDLFEESSLSKVPPPPNIPSERWKELLKPIISERPFLWPNHIEALRQGFLDENTSAVVSFPTGAGKSTLSELKIAAALALDGAVIFLAPTHALVSQTKKSLSAMFPGIPVRDSLLVEDFYAETDEEIAPHSAQIVVITPERCLALLSQAEGEFQAVRLVIFDECHLIHPNEQGQNRRSIDAMLCILHLAEAAPHADWLLLSAMMENAGDIAGWLEQLIGRRCIPLPLDWKPTRQARGCLVYDEKEILNLRAVLKQAETAARALGELKSPNAAVQKALKARPFSFFCLLQTWQTRSVQDYTLVPLLDATVPLSAALGKDEDDEPLNWYLTPNKNKVAAHLAAQCVGIGLKVLLFSQDTRGVRSIADEISGLLGAKEQVALSKEEAVFFEVARDELGEDSAVLAPSSWAAAHHALMLPTERELAERLFRRADGIGALAATATLAQGMNLPADIVVIVGDARFDRKTEAFLPLDAHELLNAAGRAGRAGHVAQGMVIVLPHSLVHFDGQRKIGKAWMKLQEAVFSRTDQCLSIQDPLQFLLDKLTDASAREEPDVRYLLRRLPPRIDTDADLPKRFLRRTLGAWFAKRKGTEKAFETTIERTLEIREALKSKQGLETWRDELSYRTGIAVDFIESLHHALLILPARPSTTEGWVRWFFGWVSEEKERLQAVLGHRFSPELWKSIEKADLFGGRLADAVWAWMMAETFKQLNARTGGAGKKLGVCEYSRKFVLKMIPDLAFSAGLAARIRRKQLEEVGDTKMPLVLGTLALCIREGVAEPEIAALRAEKQHTVMSRQSLRRAWLRLQEFIEPRDAFESFGRTRKRVSTAIAVTEILAS